MEPLTRRPLPLDLLDVAHLRRAVRATGARWADRDRQIGSAIHNNRLYGGRVFVTAEQIEPPTAGKPTRYTVRLLALDGPRAYCHWHIGAIGAFDHPYHAHAAARRVGDIAYLLPAELLPEQMHGLDHADSDARRIARLCDIPTEPVQVPW